MEPALNKLLSEVWHFIKINHPPSIDRIPISIGAQNDTMATIDKDTTTKLDNRRITTVRLLQEMQHLFTNPNVLAKILVIGFMPFMIAAATRLPFIYFVIHLVQHFHFDWLSVGFYVAIYQANRVVAAALAITYPRLSHGLGTAISLAGYAATYVADDDLIVPFVAGTAVVGFAESQPALQKYIKAMCPSNPGQMLGQQYAFVFLGAVFSFLIGGYAYEKYNIKGVALFGALIQFLALIAFFVYHCIVSLPCSTKIEDNNGDDNKVYSIKRHSENTTSSSEQDQETFVDHENDIILSNSSTGTPSTRSVDSRSLSEDEEHHHHDRDKKEMRNLEGDVECCQYDDGEGMPEKKKKEERTVVAIKASPSTITNTFNTSDSIPTTWINWILCISFGVEAISIGYQLSIGPIFILSQFKKDTATIGLLFALGSFLGNFLAIGSTRTSFGKWILSKVVKSPFDICFAIGGIAIGSLLATVPNNFPCYVVGIMLVFSFNDFATMLLTELQASITTISNYSMIGPMGQVIRRALNVVTALTGPVFFGLFPSLPYIVAGYITLSWGVLLFVAFV